MAPIEYPLRVQFCMIRVANVEYVFPRYQHVVKQNGSIQLVALGGKRMFDGILRDQTFATDDCDTLRVGRAHSIDDLVAFGARAKEHAEMEVISEGGSCTDRLDAINKD